MKVHAAAEVAPEDRVTLVGQEAVSPADVLIERLTGPDSPERLVKLTVLEPEEPCVKEVDDAEMLKSNTVTWRTTE